MASKASSKTVSGKTPVPFPKVVVGVEGVRLEPLCKTSKGEACVVLPALVCHPALAPGRS